MNNYLHLLDEVKREGRQKQNRTGIKTRSVFGRQMVFDLRDGFPLLTTKKVHTKSIIHELLWLIKGETNIKYLKENNVSIWDEWADANGDLGPIYGKQWRNWEQPNGKSIDQLQNAIDELKNNPDSRRIIVSAWNPSDLPRMALAPCHAFFQFNTDLLTLEERFDFAKNQKIDFENFVEKVYFQMEKIRKENIPNSDIASILNVAQEKVLDGLSVPKRYLSCQLYQRSADLFLGVPFNIASYSLLTEMIAQVTNMIPHQFIWTGGDVHIYENHLEQVNIQLQRSPKKLAKLVLNKKIETIDDFKFEDIEIQDYQPDPAIKAPVAI